jgi:hypothetical protein
MIDKEHAGKEIYFELSVGLAGNTLDAKPEKTVLDFSSDDEDDDDDDSDDEPSDRSALLRKWREEQQSSMPCLSTTPPMLPRSDDRKYYYVPLGNKKPCMYACSKFEDLRKRLFHQNLIFRIIDALVSQNIMNIVTLIFLFTILNIARLDGILYFEIIKF